MLSPRSPLPVVSGEAAVRVYIFATMRPCSRISTTRIAVTRSVTTTGIRLLSSENAAGAKGMILSIGCRGRFRKPQFPATVCGAMGATLSVTLPARGP